jgi:hypothetical protein
VEAPRLWDEVSPERIVGGRQLWDHVLAAIDRLPAAQRAVLILRDIEQCESEEACALLQITAENQRVLLHRARGRVRATIDSLLGTAPVAVARAVPGRRTGRATDAVRRCVVATFRLLAGVKHRAPHVPFDSGQHMPVNA